VIEQQPQRCFVSVLAGGEQERCSPTLIKYTVDTLAPSEVGAYPCIVSIEARLQNGVHDKVHFDPGV
jgi:hypothetical protein